MEWIGDPVVEREVREQRFDVEYQGRTVPGLLWTPESGGESRPIALLGHGASLHKRADYILATARRLVRHHGISAITIDGPAHGDRREDWGSDREEVRRDFEKTWQQPAVTDQTVADWKMALDAVDAQLGVGPVGYFGLSMGTMMGLPLVAAEPRVRVAVLGLMGAQRAAPGRRRSAHLLPGSLPRQWDDELVPRDRALELFDLLASREKALRATRGDTSRFRPTSCATSRLSRRASLLSRRASSPLRLRVGRAASTRSRRGAPRSRR